jgi:hypothetical protein
MADFVASEHITTGNRGFAVRHERTAKAQNARQTLCRAFFVGAHDKGRTVAFYTVKRLCRAPRLTTHGKKKQLTAPEPNGV